MAIASDGKGRTGTGAGSAVADYTLHRLLEWGIERIYGYPGDGINGLLYAKYAELQLRPAWDEALATADRPVVLEVKVDNEIPPLPPHIKFSEAKKMAQAMVGDEPERAAVIKQSLKGKAVEIKEAILGKKGDGK